MHRHYDNAQTLLNLAEIGTVGLLINIVCANSKMCPYILLYINKFQTMLVCLLVRPFIYVQTASLAVLVY